MGSLKTIWPVASPSRNTINGRIGVLIAAAKRAAPFLTAMWWPRKSIVLLEVSPHGPSAPLLPSMQNTTVSFRFNASTNSTVQRGSSTQRDLRSRMFSARGVDSPGTGGVSQLQGPSDSKTGFIPS